MKLSDCDILEKVVHYKLLTDNKMNNGIGKLDWVNVKSALIYGLLWGILAICIYAVQVGDLFALNWHDLVNAGGFGFLGVFVSLLKNFLTTNSGNFLGSVKVIPPIDNSTN